MKLIPLTRGLECMIDDEDHALLSLINWYVGRNKTSQKSYARNDVFGRMHRFLMMANSGQEVDHIDGNSLNNQKHNLRICSLKENRRNRSKNLNSKNRYKGAYFMNGKWISKIRVDDKMLCMGPYLNEEDAAKSYDDAAKKYYGEFAKLNFPIK